MGPTPHRLSRSMDQGERVLRPSDHVLISAHRLHRVTWTMNGGPTIWLAVHFC
jgi:cupin 2 domain-containing protein